MLERPYFFEHAEWFKLYVAGWYARAYLGEEISRDKAEARMEGLLIESASGLHVYP